MSRSAAARKRRSQDRKGWILIIIAVCILGGILFSYFRLENSGIALDEETLCPKDFPPSEIHAILIDCTDSPNAVQKAAIRQHLEAIKADAPRFGLMELYTVGPINNKLLKAEIRICNPGKGEDLNEFFGNPALAEKKWRTDFSSRVEKVFDRILGLNSAKQSPILEGIQSVSVSAFGVPGRSSAPKKLTIVSDMLHHSAEYSQYSGVLDFQQLRSSSYYRRIRPRLDGVEVTILYLRRETSLGVQGREHIEFWQEFVAESGGVLVRVVAVTG